ncbi:MAG: TIGR01777 family oxidoreductase [Actinomycetota bacterium]
MDIAVTGSSGLIGTRLMARLREEGHRPIAVVRRAPKAGADEIEWQPAAGTIDAASLEGVDAVINLAGAGIGDKRWNDAYRKLLVTSRIDSTSLLAETLAGLDKAPSVLLSGSAIGYYGNRADEELTEASSPGDDFLAELCVDWEAAAKPAVDASIRTAYLRTGIVLTPDGGALAKMLPLFKLGVGGRFGAGRQYMSWITLDDEVEAIIALLTNDVSGPVNLTAPGPVTNADFTAALGRALGRPTLFPVPAFGPKLLRGGDMAQALLFDSQRVLPTVLQNAGYGFHHAEIEAGLRAVIGREEVAA